MVLEVMAAVAGIGLLAVVWVTHRQQRDALARRQRAAPVQLERYPALTVIRPIRGLDAGAAENLRAALDSGYPGQIETLFVFDDASEPALPLARAAIAEHRAARGHGGARVVFAGTPPAGRTGKLNAMMAGLRTARGAVVAFADSDIRPDRDALRVLIETLHASPRTGSAFAPVIVAEPTQTAGDAGYALLLNGLYGPAAALTSERRGGTLPFIMGQFMAFRREALMAIGGLECADGQLVDDMFLGERVVAAGYENRVSPHAVPIIQRGLDTWPFLSIYRRWITFSRSGLPGRDFKFISWLRGALFWIGAAGAAAATLLGAPAAAGMLLLVAVTLAASVNALHAELGGAPLPWRHAWVSFALLLGAPAVYLSIFARHQVSWRGRTYQLTPTSRLATAAPSSPLVTMERAA